MEKHLIFDFDGTLVDSFNAVVEKFNLLAVKFGFHQIDLNEVCNLKELNSKQLITRFQIPFHKIPVVIKHARKMMHKEIVKLPPFLNIQTVLTKLHRANFSLSIMTSNSMENVLLWLEHNQMQELFNFTYSNSSFFWKNRTLKKIIEKYQLKRNEVFYIGDETRDIDAAKKAGISSIAVTWGFNSEKILLEYRPQFVARKPEDLLAICGI